MAFHQLYKHRESAERVRSRYVEKVDGIRSDRDLNDEARQRRIAEAYQSSQGELQKLRDAESADLHVRRRDLERSLYGASGVRFGQDAASHAISARDASDRAAQLNGFSEAAELLSRAEADGDELLARAIARRCMQGSEQAMTRSAANEWEGVVRSFLEARPSLMTVVDELAEIENMSERQIFSPFSLPQPHGVEASMLNTAGAPEQSEVSA